MPEAAFALDSPLGPCGPEALAFGSRLMDQLAARLQEPVRVQVRWQPRAGDGWGDWYQFRVLTRQWGHAWTVSYQELAQVRNLPAMADIVAAHILRDAAARGAPDG